MALLEIKTAGDPVLKEISKPVEKIDKRLRKLLDDMAETMYASEGIGIAAPQIGKSIRVCVVDVDRKDRNNRYDLINPVITFREGSVVDNEGCLSCPDLFGDKKTLEAEGLLARCIQHEIDHLDGQLFIDIAKNITKGRPEKK